MSRFFKTLLPYWKTIILIIALLFLQAYGDLSLPQYTSDIIDTGIQNGGVSHVCPKAITKEEFEIAKIFVEEENVSLLEEIYDEDGGIYRLNVKNEKRLDELDDIFAASFILNNQMSSVDGEDMRLTVKAMLENGLMSKADIIAMRDELADTMESVGSSMIKSMAIAYALEMDELAGVDMDKMQTNYLLTAGAKMAAMAFLIAIITVLVGLLASRVGAGVGRDLRGNVYKKVMGFSNAEMDKFSTASMITRTTNDIQQIQMVTVMILRMVLYAPILGVGGIMKVVQTGAGMGWVIALAVAAIIVLVIVLMVVAMPKFQLMQKLVDGVNLVAREILTGLSVIRAFGREKKEEERFDDANKKLTKTMLFTNRVMTFMMPSMTMIMYGLTVLIVWVASHKIDSGTMQVGAMTAFITYAMQIVMAFLMLTMMSIMLPRAAVASNRIDEVLNTHSMIEDPEKPETIETKKGVVAFNHVNFKYPGAKENALTDINFVAEPGKTTAIIGSTGCGKSTLVNLIPRLYDVTDGSVTIDGHDVRNITMKALRDLLGFVPQKGVLFSGTIASNLRYGRENATDEEIRTAAEIAQAAEFIEEKNAKYESPIAQGGSNVSGGQKQRLSIARAIAKNPKVFIFDDSFSALDLKTDAALRKALASKVSGSTVIIVAQRISTVIHAEQILVMDEGRIVGKGTHEELMKNCEVYQQIAKSQMSAKELGLEENAGKEE
jgi:ATP-binding cassette subfamily B protein